MIALNCAEQKSTNKVRRIWNADFHECNHDRGHINVFPLIACIYQRV